MLSFRLIVPIVLITVCACGGTDHSGNEHLGGHAPPAATHAPLAAHWDYGDDGPSRWAELSPEYAICAEGTRQSPIDLELPGTGENTIAHITFKSGPGVLASHEHVEDIVDNGHTIQVSFDDASEIILDGVPYELQQFHFHTPAEHTVNRKRFPMEMHYVHRSEAGRFLVVGVLCVEGAQNEAFDHLVTNLPGHGETRHVEHVTTDLEEMAPGGSRGYRYYGSLTTPPCLEDVTWLIVARPIEMSAGQLDAFADRMGHNARPVQPLNGRMISGVTMADIAAR